MTDDTKTPSTETPSDSVGHQGGIDPRVLNLLVCPKTHGPLIYDREAKELISRKAKLAYPIREGVPVLLIDEARAL